MENAVGPFTDQSGADDLRPTLMRGPMLNQRPRAINRDLNAIHVALLSASQELDPRSIVEGGCLVNVVPLDRRARRQVHRTFFRLFLCPVVG
jgi:hypothetical protein